MEEGRNERREGGRKEERKGVKERTKTGRKEVKKEGRERGREMLSPFNIHGTAIINDLSVPCITLYWYSCFQPKAC